MDFQGLAKSPSRVDQGTPVLADRFRVMFLRQETQDGSEKNLVFDR
jgi:hypothetical protein